MKTVLIAGYFDPIHQGHLEHIRQAGRLGEYLVIVTHTDDCTLRVKGNCFTTQEFRIFMLTAILRELRQPGLIVVTERADMADMLRRWQPDIFAKGGDRTPDNMPLPEILTCQQIGCEIVYGVGRQLQSSTAIKQAVQEVTIE